MGEVIEDVLGWLLPEAPAVEEHHARRVVTFLRLLRDDARGQGAEFVGVDLAGARLELERGDQKRRLDALSDLLRYYLQTALSSDSYVSFGQPRNSFQRAWNELKGLDVPGPGESALELAARLFASARRLGAGPRWLSVWRIRMRHVRLGFVAALPAWRLLLCRARKSKDATLARAALQGLVQGHLDRGDLKSVQKLLGKHAELVDGHPELRRCRVWACLASADFGAARAASRGQEERDMGLALPLPLAQLRERMPGWASVLQGLPHGAGVQPVASVLDGRCALGARVLCVLRLEVERDLAQIVKWDAQGAKDNRIKAFLARRSGAWTRPGEAEHRAIVLGKPTLLHASVGRPLEAALHRDSRGLALVPIKDGNGEPVGWLHLEFEHHLLPCTERLEALAGAWSRQWSLLGPPCAGASARVTMATSLGDRELAREARALLGRIPMGLCARRAVLFDPLSDGSWRATASAGGGFGDMEPGAGRAVQRVQHSGAPFGFNQRQGLGGFPSSSSGILAPILFGKRVLAILSVESDRRGNFSGQDLGKLSRFARTESEAWSAAKFNAWHLNEYGESVDTPQGTSWWQASAWLGLPSSRQPLCLRGEAHTGKSVLARWMHHEGRGPHRPFVGLWIDQAGLRSSVLARAWESAGGGTLCLGNPALLSAARQNDLAGRIRIDLRQSFKHSVRVVLLADEARGTSELLPALASRFEPLELCLPALRNRRDQIPRLVRRILASQALGEGRQPVQLNDAAIGLLWRQEWPDNLKGLKSVLMRVAILNPGKRVRAEQLHELAVDLRMPLRRRMPSLNPNLLDLRAALDQTRCANGRLNKCRAAMYMGWDPDTLVAHMRSL